MARSRASLFSLCDDGAAAGDFFEQAGGKDLERQFLLGLAGLLGIAQLQGRVKRQRRLMAWVWHRGPSMRIGPTLAGLQARPALV